MLIFQSCSAIVGGLAVLSVCFIFVKNNTFEKAGLSLLVAGTILIGLPVWSSAKFAFDANGIQVEFSTIVQKLEGLEQKASSSSVEIEKLTSAVETVQETNNWTLAHIKERQFIRPFEIPVPTSLQTLPPAKVEKPLP